MNQKNLATTSQYLHGRSPKWGILSDVMGEAEARTQRQSDKLAGSDQHKTTFPR